MVRRTLTSMLKLRHVNTDRSTIRHLTILNKYYKLKDLTVGNVACDYSRTVLAKISAVFICPGFKDKMIPLYNQQNNPSLGHIGYILLLGYCISKSQELGMKLKAIR